jgi:serine/threonine protein kinase
MNGWVGQALGKVRIDSLLAKGGMAEVYIGTHTTLQREVAVKVLRNNYDEHPHALERFQREALVVGKLRHPNIVQVFDFDTVNSHPFLVMEYVRGPSLLKYLNSLHEKGKRLEFTHVVRLMNAMTSALQYAHDSGVVHRDIKPGNILLASRSEDIVLGKPLPDDFEPVLTDFGLVRFIDSTQHTTGSGQIAGTPAYMSPEQARGDLTDGRTDVYSLGIVLYEMLAGHLPFEGETTMGVLMKHINEPPPPIEGLPTAMQYLLDRALAKDVDDRFQTPAEFGDAFTQAVENRADYSTLDVLSSHKPTRKPARNLFSRGSQKPLRNALVILTVLVAAASVLLSRVLPLGVEPSTPTGTNSPTQPQPSSTATSTQTPMPVVLLGRTGVLHIQNSSAVADQASLVAVALLAPPVDNQYEVWLVNEEERLSMGILTLDSIGRGELTFTSDRGSNLLADYSGVEISIEPNPDADPEPSGIVAYSYSLPDNGLTHLRYILVSFPSAPDENALIQGLLMNVETIDELAKEMHKASINGNGDRVRLNAEAILNIIVGDQSPNHRDWNGDGIVDDPGDGYGLLLNGRNLGYLQSVYTEAEATVNSPGASQPMITHGERLMTSVQNLALWTQQLQELVTEILASPPPPDIDQKVARAADLTDKMLSGIDLDEDGLIKPVPGEAGAQVAYEQAFRMADMPLVAVGITNIGTGTPTFIITAPTATSVSGGAGGSGGNAAPTQRVPPGQTRIPPGQENKTPKTDNPGNNNNGNNGGGNNSNNGNNSDP